MRICMKCGAESSDEASFCNACGQAFDEPLPETVAEPEEATAEATVTGGTQAVRPAQEVLRKECSGWLLPAVFAFMVFAILLSTVCGVVLTSTIEIGLSQLRRLVVAVNEELGGIGALDGLVQGISAIHFSDTYGGKVKLAVFALSSANLFTAVGLGLMYSAARKGKGGIGGIVLLKLVVIVKMLLWLALAMALSVGGNYAAGLLGELTEGMEFMAHLEAIGKAVRIVPVVLCFVPVLFRLTLLRSLTGIGRIFRTGNYRGGVSGAGGVFLIVANGIAALRQLGLMVAEVFAMPVALPASLTAFYVSLAGLLLGVLLIRLKVRLSEANCNEA